LARRGRGSEIITAEWVVVKLRRPSAPARRGTRAGLAAHGGSTCHHVPPRQRLHASPWTGAREGPEALDVHADECRRGLRGRTGGLHSDAGGEPHRRCSMSMGAGAACTSEQPGWVRRKLYDPVASIFCSEAAITRRGSHDGVVAVGGAGCPSSGVVVVWIYRPGDPLGSGNRQIGYARL
jgi:hypothetical protein